MSSSSGCGMAALDLDACQPLGDRIWFVAPDPPTQTASGLLFLPESAKEFVSLQGEIVARGQRVHDPLLQPGLRVVVPRFGAVRVGELTDRRVVWAIGEADVKAAVITSSEQ